MRHEYFAKSSPPYTLEQHSEDVAERTVEYVKQFPDGQFEEYDTLNMKRLAWITGYLHDTGKANPAWQNWVHDIIQTEHTTYTDTDEMMTVTSPTYKPNHSAVSAALAIGILNTEPYSDISEHQMNSIFLAILHHHTGWTVDNMRYESQITQSIGDILKTLDEFPGEIFPEPTLSADSITNAAQYVRNKAESETSSNWDTIRRTALVLYAGLRQSDWTESGQITGGNPNFPSTFDIQDDFDEFEQMRSFQRMIASHADTECLLGLAGCGEGKTYSALLWGKTQRNLGNLNRIIFAMPTQVTTNNLYFNMSGSTIAKESISLYHGATDYIDDLYATHKDIPDVEMAELYQAPVNVTTVDHVIDTFVSNYSNSPISFVNMLSAGIVFDEIQAYDDRTTQNILACIQQCRKLGIPVYVMSATIPKRIRSEIPHHESVHSTGKLDDTQREPYEVAVQRHELGTDDFHEHLKDEHDKVIVVKNTVREAQSMARKLDETESLTVFYYSSEFSQTDRRDKERQIKKEFAVGNRDNSQTKVLVCTQICEISLDLSAHLLLTDIAPIDSIFQRLGRLHRDGVSHLSHNCDCDDCKNADRAYEAIVYDSTDSSDAIYPYATDKNSKDFRLLADTADELSDFGVYSFTKSVESTDRVYENYPTNYSTQSYELNAEYGDSYFQNRSERYEIRDIKTNKKSVLLNDAYSTLLTKDGVEHANQTSIVGSTEDMREYYHLNAVPIPSYWIHSSDIETQRINLLSDGLSIPVYPSLEYDYENGVHPPKNQ